MYDMHIETAHLVDVIPATFTELQYVLPGTYGYEDAVRVGEEMKNLKTCSPPCNPILFAIW
jgi:hypothetical protein